MTPLSPGLSAGDWLGLWLHFSLLSLLAADLNEAIPDVNLVAVAIGLASAVIDNVPLVSV